MADDPTIDWRAPTADDLADWAELIGAMEDVDRTGERYTPEELAEELAGPGFEPDLDGRLGRTADGDLVAFGLVQGRSADEQVVNHRIGLWGGVHPRRRRRGIGTELLGWMTARGAARHRATHPDATATLEVSCVDTQVGKAALLAGAGFTPVRHWYEMTRDLRTTPIESGPEPKGLELQRYRSELAEATRQAHNDTFADHWGFAPAGPERWQHRFVGGANFRPDLSFVLVDGDLVVAYLLTSVFPQDDAERGAPHGWIASLGSRRSHRGRGLATALLRAACLAYREVGFAEALLEVDVENPSGALGLYERFGFQVERRTTSYGRVL